MTQFVKILSNNATCKLLFNILQLVESWYLEACIYPCLYPFSYSFPTTNRRRIQSRVLWVFQIYFPGLLVCDYILARRSVVENFFFSCKVCAKSSKCESGYLSRYCSRIEFRIIVNIFDTMCNGDQRFLDGYMMSSCIISNSVLAAMSLFGGSRTLQVITLFSVCRAWSCILCIVLLSVSAL